MANECMKNSHITSMAATAKVRVWGYEDMGT
jgi:hypothetical protein